MTATLRHFCRTGQRQPRLLFQHAMTATQVFADRGVSQMEITMALFNFWSRKPDRRTYDDVFLELRDQVSEQRVADTEMLDSMHDDAKTHMMLLFGEARQCMVTDPARAQQLMRLALAQGATLEAVAQERYQSSTGSLDKSFKAIAKAAMSARKALPPAAPKAVEGADVKPVVKTPPVKDPSTVSSVSKQRSEDEDFDNDYTPSRNGKQ